MKLGTRVVLSIGAVLGLCEPAAEASWTVFDEPAAWLNASDHVEGDIAHFGFSLAIDDGVIVVGAELANLPTGESDGQAYLFVEPIDGWGPVTTVRTEQAILRSCTPGFFEHNFGYDVDIDSGRVAVGARYEQLTFRDVGAGYLFQEPAGGWVTMCAPDPQLPGITEKVAAADGQADDRFGTAVTISGELALFGAPKEDEGGTNSGAAYLYSLETLNNSDPSDDLWTPVGGEKLLADFQPNFPPSPNSFAGQDVAINETAEIALVSAPNPNLAGPDPGRAYVYDLAGVTAAVQVLENPLGPSIGDNFGRAVDLSPDGTRAIVSQLEHDSIAAAGLAHIFRLDAGAWILEARLEAPDASIQDQFGNSVAIDGERAVVGVDLDSDQGPASGSAWVFVRRDGGTPDPSDDFWEPEFKLLPPSEGGDLAGQAYTRFGNAVAISGNTVVIGRSDDDWDGTLTGSAYVYELPPVFTLGANGTCPGSLTISLSGGTPQGAAILVAGSAEGTTIVPSGACADEEIDLASVLGTQAVGFDLQGDLALTIEPPAGLCGAFLQAIDLTTCRVTNISELP